MFKSLLLGIRIWFFTICFFTLAWAAGVIATSPSDIWSVAAVAVTSGVASLPVIIALALVLPFLAKRAMTVQAKMRSLYTILFIIAIPYGIIAGFLYSNFIATRQTSTALNMLEAIAVLFVCAVAAVQCVLKKITQFFSDNNSSPQHQSFNMETSHSFNESASEHQREGSNRILIKGLITGALILAMLLPAALVNNLVVERQHRQEEVVKEVSDKWASSQTLSGPFLYLPYSVITTNTDGKTVHQDKPVWILPENLEVSGTIDHELRQRSIYKVLVFRAALTSSGNFNFRLPGTVNPLQVNWKDARICYALTDFKGIEEKMTIHFNGADIDLEPGLPLLNTINGLSAPVTLSAADIGKPLDFNLKSGIKGSEKIDFMPLAGNSHFNLQSKWNSPSFDGNALPAERTVSDSGFSAQWIFNKANLPFGTVLSDIKIDDPAFTFGVTLVQPADGYAKTNRCIKYAILFIGLTFSIFFVVELFQKKPLHPVQYVLIGLALVIFYTLLLAVSEFVPFDYAYVLAAAATILLISFYARAHFQSWATASIFGATLTGLYGFIFILIQLEDTALLVGSIGLFIILAVIMFASRKINWYGKPPVALPGNA